MFTQGGCPGHHVLSVVISSGSSAGRKLVPGAVSPAHDGIMALLGSECFHEPSQGPPEDSNLGPPLGDVVLVPVSLNEPIQDFQCR